MSHEKGIEAATEVISSEHAYQLSYEAVSKGTKAYLDASDMVMVPKNATPRMQLEADRARNNALYQDENDQIGALNIAIDAALAAVPNPFQTPEESREKK